MNASPSITPAAEELWISMDERNPKWARGLKVRQVPFAPGQRKPRGLCVIAIEVIADQPHAGQRFTLSSTLTTNSNPHLARA